MGKKTVVHIVGTGTVGEPLIGLIADHQAAFGLDEITFHKRTPLRHERAKVESLVRRGAKLCVDAEQRGEFEKLGHRPIYERGEALEAATVVIDCTPAGNENKKLFYDKLRGPKGFIAQGSEFGFGKPYARGINDEALIRDEDRFVQVVSCNTHNISCLVKSLAARPDGSLGLRSGRFVCMRRANDISQDKDFIPAPVVGKHKDARFGTHHAFDAFHLFKTLGHDLNLFSSAVKVPTQYMHSMWFDVELDDAITREQALARFRENPRVALTDRMSANQIFSFGRDHGYYGRILSQTVIAEPTITVRSDHEVIGFCFTPQDGNPLLSTIAAMLWFLHPDGFQERIDVLMPYVFREV